MLGLRFTGEYHFSLVLNPLGTSASQIEDMLGEKLRYLYAYPLAYAYHLGAMPSVRYGSGNLRVMLPIIGYSWLESNTMDSVYLIPNEDQHEVGILRIIDTQVYSDNLHLLIEDSINHHNQWLLLQSSLGYGK